MDAVEQKVVDIICDYLNLEADQVSLKSDLSNDLGADSLETVELTMALEQEFGVEIDDKEAEGIKSVGDIVDIIKKKAAA